MKQIRCVFYKARFEWRNVFTKGRKIRLVDDGIALATWPLNLFTPWYSHMSVWIPGQNRNFKIFSHDIDTETTNPVFVGTCYTSTMRGDDNGTVSRPASTVFKNPERWEYIEFEVTDESFKTAVLWADLRVLRNKGYSMRDLWRFAMPLWLLKKIKLADPDREICSEHGEGWAIRLKRGVWVKRPILIEGPVLMSTLYLLYKILIRSPRRLWRDLTKRHHVPTYSLATGLMVRDSNGKQVK